MHDFYFSLPVFISGRLSSLCSDVFNQHSTAASHAEAINFKITTRNGQYTGDDHFSDIKYRNFPYKTLRFIPCMAFRIQQYTDSRINPYPSSRFDLNTVPGTDLHKAYRNDPYTTSYIFSKPVPYTAAGINPYTASTVHAPSTIGSNTNSRIGTYKSARIFHKAISRLNQYEKARKSTNTDSRMTRYNNYNIRDIYSNRLKRGGSTQPIYSNTEKRRSRFSKYFRYYVLSTHAPKPSRRMIRTKYGYVFMYVDGRRPLDSLASGLLGRKWTFNTTSW